MDSQNTSQEHSITPKKRKSKRSLVKDDTDIKKVITKKTKNLKKSNFKSLYVKKTIYTIILASVIASVSYYAYDFYKKRQYSDEWGQFDTTKQQPEQLSPFYKDPNVELQLKNFNSDDLEAIHNVIKNNSINENIIEISNDERYSLQTVISYLKDDFHILNANESKEYNSGYFDMTTGITFDSSYNVIGITPYSNAWRKGIRLSYKLEQIDGKNLKTNLSSDDINNALITHKNSRWMFNDKERRRITFPQFQKEYPAGDIAESWVFQNTLILRIKKINTVTANIINDLINSRLKSNENIKGVIIDLRGTGDDYYVGLPQTTWILNQQKIEKIAKLNSLNNESDIVTSNPNLTLDTNIIQKFNKLPQIVWVDYQTKGSGEILANNLIKNGAKINGFQTEGSEFKKDIFNINNKYAVALTDKKVSLPDGKPLQITPLNNKAIYFVDMIYEQKRK